MKTCPKCGELNGNNRTTCLRCKISLGPAETYKKICPKCGIIYSQNTQICTQCGTSVGVYDGAASSFTDSSSRPVETWMYVVAVLAPYIALVLGCIYIAQREEHLGKTLIITSLVSGVVLALLLSMFVSCSRMM